MSPVYMYPQYSSSIPFLELKGDQQHGYHDHVTSSNNTYFSRLNSENPRTSSEFLAMDYSNRPHEKEKRTNLDQVRIVEDGSCCSNMYTFDKQRDHKVDQKYKKCKPTKLRIMQTWKTTAISTTNMIGERNNQQDHLVQPPSKVYCNTSIENDDSNGLKMCSDCHTTTTPLWRSGPKGPKSLCNACGIRQRKARRAAAIAAAAAATEVAKDRNVISPISSSTMPNSKAPKLIVDEMTSEVKLDPVQSHTLPLKKRSKILSASWGYDDTTNTTTTTNIDDSINNNCRKEKKLRIEDFPRDVVQGAILLMALSSG